VASVPCACISHRPEMRQFSHSVHDLCAFGDLFLLPRRDRRNPISFDHHGHIGLCGSAGCINHGDPRDQERLGQGEPAKRVNRSITGLGQV
jgi:hypothetical protein